MSLKKEIKNLEAMKKKGMSATVISAQEKVVADLEAQIQQAESTKKIKATEIDGQNSMTFSIYNEVTRETTQEKRKVALVKNNRPIEQKKVDGFINIIANNKYEEAYPIITMEARKVKEKGYTVTDINGKEVEEEQIDEFLVILDGQHRTKAFMSCSITNENIIVPNVRLREVDNVGEYLVDINNVGTSWKAKDRFAVAALTSNNEIAKEIAGLINEGFNPTTASMIYTRNKISPSQINKLLKGGELTLPKGAVVDIQRGNKFVQLCKEAGMSVKFITKRYFIDGFNSYATSTSDEEALAALQSLKGSLTEDALKRVDCATAFVEILKGENSQQQEVA